MNLLKETIQCMNAADQTIPRGNEQGVTTMKLKIKNAINSAIDMLLTATGAKEAAISLMGDDVPLYCRDCGEPVTPDGDHIEESSK